MFRTLRGRLGLAFVALAVSGVALVSLLINVVVEQQFEEYIRGNMQERSHKVVRLLEESYKPPAGWTEDLLAEVTHWTLLEGLEITLKSPTGMQLWHTSDAEPIVPIPYQHPHPVPDKPRLTISEPVVTGGQTVAVLYVTSGPQGLYSEHDLHFRSGLNKVLEGSALAAALLAVAVAWLVSRGMLLSLVEMTRVAEKMRTGDWKQRVPSPGVTEVQRLADSINHLAVSLQHHEEMRKRMTRDVAHELRTPLAVLQSHLEAIQDGIWEPTPDRIGLVHQEVMRLVPLVGDLDQLAEAESEAMHLECTEVRVRSLLDSLAAGHGPLFAQKRIHFQSKLPPDDVVVNVDRDKASQVVINLLANAYKYTPDGGSVVLEATSDASEVFIMVSDTGPGVLAEDIPKIFERFYRGDPSRTRATGGAGLGLAIAKTLAEAHQGRLEVYSTPGRGTVFIFALPRARVASSA